MLNIRITQKLLLYCLFIALTFPLLIIFVFFPSIDSIEMYETSQETLRLANYIVHTLNLHDSEFRGDSFGEEQQKEINVLKDQFNLYEVSLYSKEGVIEYSTNTAKRGFTLSHDLFESTFAVDKNTTVFRPKGSRSYEGFLLHADVMATHLPIVKENRIIGGVEIYCDITDEKKAFEKLKTLFAALFFFIGFCLLLLIASTVSREEKSKERSEMAEKELAKEQLRSEAIFESMGDNVIVQDRNYKIVYQNRVNKETFGNREGELCHKVYEGIDHICEGCPVAITFEDGQVHRYEKRVQRDNGFMYVEMVSSPLYDENGRIIAGVKVVRDITERKNLEEQLFHALKMKAIGQLAGGIAHDFNNILTSIKGHGNFLEMKTEEDSPLRSNIHSILLSAEKAADLTRSLLAFSRKQIINPKVVRLNDVIKGLIVLLKPLIGENIELRTLLAEEDLPVLVDPGQIEQSIMNLAANARDAMPKGGTLTIRTGQVEFDNEYVKVQGYGVPGRYALLSIEDNGEGMDEETRGKIFEPFFTTKEEGKGTGLGLAMVYGIVKQNNGYINVYSEAGKGTTFKVFFPPANEEKTGEKTIAAAHTLHEGVRREHS